MIYLDDQESTTLYSIIESIYLSEKLSDRLSNSNIVVCPENTKYIIRKTVVINNTEYSKSKIEALLNNECNLISRVKTHDDIPNIKFQPYIIRPDFNVMWNGMSINVSECTNISDIIDKLENRIIFDNGLYFPKLYGLKNNLIQDKESNLTALGWLMHQVGINLGLDQKFRDLDLLKTRKCLPERHTLL